MSTHRTNASVSRRTALAGLGAGGLGLAAAPGASAQDASANMVTHPIVGIWFSPFDVSFVYNVFQAGGTFLSLHPFAGMGVGLWQATGERTLDTICKYLNIAGEAGAGAPGVVTVWGSVTVNTAGTSTSGEGAVELRGPDGAVVAFFPNAWEEGADARLMVEPPPPLPTPEAATPRA